MSEICERYQAQFNEFIDRELAPEACAELERHLEQCAVCRRELRMLRLTVASVQKLSSPPAPQDFLIKLRQRIASEQKAVRAGVFQRANRWLMSHPAMIAAGFVVVFTCAFILGRLSPKVSMNEGSVASEMEPVQAWEGDFERVALVQPVASSGAVYDIAQPSVSLSAPVAKMPGSPSSASGLTSASAINEEKASGKEQSAGQLFLQTPTQLVINLLRSDPEFQGARIYPISHGALAQTSDFVFRITLSDQNFIQALKWVAEKKGLPKSILDAQKAFGLEIEKLPNPVKPEN